MARARMIGVGAMALGGAYLALVRPRILRWGATEEEIRKPLPGKDIVPGARRDASTMAVTIHAPPDRVWPWLVQMGCDRAGWYSYDRLDNAGHPSAQEIVPEWQHLDAGDRLAADPSAEHWFTAALVHPQRALVLRASYDLRTMRPFDPEGSRPRCFSDSTWEFVLEEIAPATTRLVVAASSTGRPWAVDRLAKLLWWEPAHFVMQRKQLAEIKRRAEA